MAGINAPFPVCGAFNQQRYPKIDNQRTVNMYLVHDEEGKRPDVMIDTMGLLVKQTVGAASDAPCRGVIKKGDKLYGVWGDKFYEMDSGLIVTQLGSTLSTSTGVVRFSTNENEIILVDGVEGYLWNFTTSTATFPIPRSGGSVGFPTQPLDVTNVAGFFLCLQGESENWNWSGLNDGAAWDANDFDKMNSKPDQVRAIRNIDQRIFIFGNEIAEQWYLDPVGEQPFKRNNNMLLEYGVAALGSVIESHDRIIWLASTKEGVSSIRMTTGGSPIKISTPPLEDILKSYEINHGVSDAVAVIYKENGHLFYEISFKAANHTWACDLTHPDRPWLERESPTQDRFWGEHYVNFGGKHYVGDYRNNNFYEMSANYGTFNGEGFRRLRIMRDFSDPNNKLFRANRFTLDCKNGTGVSSGLDSDPIAFLSVSRDGGESFGNQLTANIGKIGKREWITRWRRLGTQRNMTFKLEFYNSVPTVVLGGSLNYEVFKR